MNPLPWSSTRGQRHLVAAADHLAARAGDAIFAAGGNAVDAAIATNAAIAVTGPHLCGMGGDLFALIHTRDGVIALNSSGRAGSGEAVRHASEDANPPVKLPSPATWTPDEIVNAKRPLPTPHRWPPAKPAEKVTTNTFSMEEVKEATDLVPTKSYFSAASRKTTAD